MKFIIATDDLKDFISRGYNIIPQKPAIPILSNFLIEAKDNEVTITASDLTLGIRCFAKAKVIEEGAIAVPAKHFASLVRELTSNTLEFTADSNFKIDLVADASKFRMHGLNMHEYPALPELSGSIKFKMKHEELKDMLFRTSFAAAKEDERPVLMGVLMRVENGQATFIGTDGKRLAQSRTVIDVDKEFKGQFVLPIKTVDEISKNLGGGEEVTVYLMDGKIAVEGETITLVSKLILGIFPDVARIIPDQSEIVIPLHREELMSLLRQVILFTTDKAQSVRFSFTEGELRLTANSSDLGEGKVTMPANYGGAQLDVAFNPGYFIDILRHSREETVNLCLTDAFNPGVITDTSEQEPVEPTSSTPLFVLMPMRLSES